MTPFDPERGTVLAEPPAPGTGHWAGAPGAWRERNDLFVTYRLRRPPPSRGYELRIASVHDGRLRTLARIDKDALDAESIERCALVHERDEWRLYISYVARVDRRWRISMLRAASVHAFDARHRVDSLVAGAVGMSAVKDPWLRRHDGQWYMFVSCGRASADPGLDATGDALSTGLVRSETGLATSADGVQWRWHGVVFSPSDAGWDRATARLTTAWRDTTGWSAYYDGSGSRDENYEERCGLARSDDLRSWHRVSASAPAVGTPNGPGGVRYVDVTEAGDIFYEYTRADGAHELRGLVASASTPAADSRRA